LFRANNYIAGKGEHCLAKTVNDIACLKETGTPYRNPTEENPNFSSYAGYCSSKFKLFLGYLKHLITADFPDFL